jgi:hypothetical protein
VVLLLAVLPAVFQLQKGYAQQLASQRNPPPITGQWHLASATKPYVTGDGLPMTDIFFEPSSRTMLRDSATVLWRAYAKADDKKHTLFLVTESNDPVTYAMTQPDPTHLVLKPTGDATKTAGTLTLVRVPLPSHYPLQDRGFHFVNEWGLER